MGYAELSHTHLHEIAEQYICNFPNQLLITSKFSLIRFHFDKRIQLRNVYIQISLPKVLDV